jgi:hypothetical protein
MKSVSTAVRGVIAIAAATWLAACQNPVTAGDHLRPEGFTLSDTSGLLVQGTGGRAQPVVNAPLTVRVGEELRLTMRFTDPSGTQMAQAGYFGQAQVRGAAVASWTAWTGPTTLDPAWATGTLRGIAVGTTTLRFGWMHGAPGSAHEETGWDVIVNVTP